MPRCTQLLGYFCWNILVLARHEAGNHFWGNRSANVDILRLFSHVGTKPCPNMFLLILVLVEGQSCIGCDLRVGGYILYLYLHSYFSLHIYLYHFFCIPRSFCWYWSLPRVGGSIFRKSSESHLDTKVRSAAIQLIIRKQKMSIFLDNIGLWFGHF